MKKIILVTGAEGSGKTKLSERAAQSLKMQLGRITTDNPDKPNIKTFYLKETPEDFGKQSYAVTYTDSSGFYCGITEEDLENSEIFVVSFNALEAFRQQYRGEREIVTIGIVSPADVRRARLSKRIYVKDVELAAARGDEINAQLAEVCDRIVLNGGSFGGALTRLEQIILMNLYYDSPCTKYFAYEVYCSEWFSNHGITLRYILGLIGNLIEDIYGDDTGDDIAEFLWEYLSMQSFDNETVKTADEFFETDYASKKYRNDLLDKVQNKYHLVNFFADRRRDCASDISEL